MRRRFWLGLYLSCFAACVACADTMIRDIAGGLDDASTGIVDALHQISLVLGVALVLRSISLFKKNSRDPQSVSFMGALWWAVLGIGLVLVYFFI